MSFLPQAQEKQAGRNITAYSQASNALATLLQAARNTMEKHLKDFLRACLEERYHAQSRKKSLFGSSDDSSLSTKNRNLQSEAGMFSLGIIDQDFLDREQTATADPLTTSSRRATIMAMTISEFVMNVLFAKTTNGRQPQIRHALFFRKSINHWSTLSNAALDALAKVTGEDTSTPSYKSSSSIPALQYLDNVIQKELLPVLQEEAVNGTVQALERSDAFDPILDQSVYNQSASNEPQNIDMCKACDALYESTAPLFLALHRLPQGGEMYLPLVGESVYKQCFCRLNSLHFLSLYLIRTVVSVVLYSYSRLGAYHLDVPLTNQAANFTTHKRKDCIRSDYGQWKFQDDLVIWNNHGKAKSLCPTLPCIH